jgi:hypothetical protein
VSMLGNALWLEEIARYGLGRAQGSCNTL